MAKLAGNVFVAGHGWFGPSYPDAGDPPKGLVTNPACWEDGDVPASTDPPGGPDPDAPGASGFVGTPPPKSGKGSTDAAWTKYAEANNVQVTEDMSRSEVIAAVEAAGVPTE